MRQKKHHKAPQCIETVDHTVEFLHGRGSSPLETKQSMRTHRKLGKFSAVALLATGVLSANVGANDTGSSFDTSIKPGDTLTVDGLEPNKILIGYMASIGAGTTGGWGAAYESLYGGTAVTNVKREGHVSGNTAILNTGNDGAIELLSGVVAQDHVFDSKMVITNNGAFELLENPARKADTRETSNNFGPGDKLVLNFGAEHAGKGAIINITIDRPQNPGFVAAFPCEDGWQGTASLNAGVEGATPSTNVVKIDSRGQVCIISNVNSAGLIVDEFGKLNLAVDAPDRTLDTRKAGGQILQPGSELVIETGKPNSVFIGRLAIADAPGGWFSAFPTSAGYQGDALVNTEPGIASSSLIIIQTDENGRFSIIGNVPGHVIIDRTAVVSAEDFGIDETAQTIPRRLVDTRDVNTIDENGFGVEILEATGPNPVMPRQLGSITCEYPENAETAGVFLKNVEISINGLAPSDVMRLEFWLQSTFARFGFVFNPPTDPSGQITASAGVGEVYTIEGIDEITIDPIIIVRQGIDGTLSSSTLRAKVLCTPGEPIKDFE